VLIGFGHPEGDGVRLPAVPPPGGKVKFLGRADAVQFL
jgi:hypothetical protein